MVGKDAMLSLAYVTVVLKRWKRTCLAAVVEELTTGLFGGLAILKIAVEAVVVIFGV
jgi:hypothetical protein